MSGRLHRRNRKRAGQFAPVPKAEETFMSESAEHASARQSQDTFPRLLFFHGQRRPDKIAVREKDLGIWQSWSWSEVAEHVAALASGLAELGFKRGDNLAIIGDNRPRLYWTMAAVQSLGGVPVPLYQDAIAQEMKFVLDNAEIKFAIASW
jgi:long-chain acyl-CoA synthetase